jgi:hypothetical protein
MAVSRRVWKHMREKEKLTCGAYTSAIGGREKQQGFFGPYGKCIHAYGLTVSLDVQKT